MKKIRILICVIAVSLLTGSIPVYAEGGSNLDTGGGGISHGTVSCNWPGESYQGVRVTVVNAETGSAVGSPVDFSNKDLTSVSGSMIHFGKVSKLRSFAGNAGDIEDPWYTGAFDKVYEQILEGCLGLLKQLYPDLQL